MKTTSLITGANYNLLAESDTISKNRYRVYAFYILTYTAIYAMAGFGFSSILMEMSLGVSLVSALVTGFFVLCLNRMVIITDSGSVWLKGFRVAIVLTMNLIAVLVIDAAMFHKDISNYKSPIDKQQAKNIRESEDYLELEKESDWFQAKIEESDSLKNYEIGLNKGLGKNAKQFISDRNKYESERKDVLARIGKLIEDDKIKQESANNGIINTTMRMLYFIWEKPIALVVWCLIFTFILSLELMIIITKSTSDQTLYDLMIERETLRKTFALTHNSVSEKITKKIYADIDVNHLNEN